MGVVTGDARETDAMIVDIDAPLRVQACDGRADLIVHAVEGLAVPVLCVTPVNH